MKWTLAFLVFFSSSVAAVGCIGSSSNQPTGTNVGLEDGGNPIHTADGSVNVDAASDAGFDAAIFPEAGMDAGGAAAFVTGLGPGVVAHSSHFTIITKTGNEPGGAGVKSSASFKMISGASPAGK